MTVAPARRRPALPRPARRSIPLADLSELGLPVRRTRAVRFVLAAGLGGVLVALVLAARGTAAASGVPLLPDADSGVIVLDLSSSIGARPDRRLRIALEEIVQSKQDFGLVVFSDEAYEAVPPGTSAAELEPFLRFFPAPARDQRRRRNRNYTPQDFARFRRAGVTTPWSGVFRGGTRIGRGLAVARSILERDRVAGPAVLLISDLDDSLFDSPQLTEELITYRREGLPLRVVGLNPTDDDRLLFSRMLGERAFVKQAELGRIRRARQAVDAQAAARESFPTGLAALAVLLLLGLALNEHACARLDWRPSRAKGTS